MDDVVIDHVETDSEAHPGAIDIDVRRIGSWCVLPADEPDQIGNDHLVEPPVGHVLAEGNRVSLVVILHGALPRFPQHRGVVGQVAPRCCGVDKKRSIRRLRQSVQNRRSRRVGHRIRVDPAFGPQQHIHVLTDQVSGCRQLRVQDVVSLSRVKVSGGTVALHTSHGHRASRGGRELRRDEQGDPQPCDRQRRAHIRPLAQSQPLDGPGGEGDHQERQARHADPRGQV